jgi:hypothetical protein
MTTRLSRAFAAQCMFFIVLSVVAGAETLHVDKNNADRHAERHNTAPLHDDSRARWTRRRMGTRCGWRRGTTRAMW